MVPRRAKVAAALNRALYAALDRELRRGDISAVPVFTSDATGMSVWDVTFSDGTVKQYEVRLTQRTAVTTHH